MLPTVVTLSVNDARLHMREQALVRPYTVLVGDVLERGLHRHCSCSQWRLRRAAIAYSAFEKRTSDLSGLTTFQSHARLAVIALWCAHSHLSLCLTAPSCTERRPQSV